MLLIISQSLEFIITDTNSKMEQPACFLKTLLWMGKVDDDDEEPSFQTKFKNTF